MEINTKYNYKRDAIQVAFATAGIALFIFSTNPQTMSVFLLLALPMLVAYLTYKSVKLITELFTDWSLSRIRFTSTVLSAGITLIVLLSSLHQLGIQDLILSASLVLGFGWYLKHLQPFDNSNQV